MKIYLILMFIFNSINLYAFDVCHRTDAIKNEIELQLKKNCSEITEIDLLNINSIIVQPNSIKNGTTLVGDFVGLKNPVPSGEIS